MQNWLRIHKYPREYLEFVYRYYASHGRAYICTYYHLDIENSTLDTDILSAGSYEVIGEYSGLQWEKITLLPIYNTEQIQVSYTGTEEGVGKTDQMSSFDIPSIYGINPTFHDYVQFEEIIINNKEEPNNYSLYRTTGLEKSTNTDISFYKLKVTISKYKKSDIENQLRETFSFVDYEKGIYQIDAATAMYRMLSRTDKLDNTSGFDDALGLYIV